MNKIAQLAFTLVGFVALILGVAGIVTPLLPHTPFFLLAAYCFAKGSPRMHRWMRSNRLTGRAITQWEDNRTISRNSKIYAIITTWITLMISVYFVPFKALVGLLVVIGVVVTCFIATRRE